MVNFPEINWNVLLPQVVLVSTGFFSLLVAIVFRGRGNNPGAGWAGAILSLAGLALTGTLSCKPAGSVFPQAFTPLPRSLAGKLKVTGSGAAHGTLQVRNGRILGTLAGRRVSTSL